MTDYQPVCETPDLGPGQSREVEAHGERVLLMNLGQRYYALEALCPESGTPLELGRPGNGDQVVCPDDQARYDVRSGERVGGQGRALRRYDVRIEENVIKVGPPR